MLYVRRADGKVEPLLFEFFEEDLELELLVLFPFSNNVGGPLNIFAEMLMPICGRLSIVRKSLT